MATQTNLPFSWDEVDRISDFVDSKLKCPVS